MQHPARLALVALLSSTVTFSAYAQPTADALAGLAAPLPGAPAAAPVACVDAPVKDPAIWDKSILAGLNYTEGNTKVTNLNLNGKVARDYENNVWRFETDYNYGSAAEGPDDPREENKNNIRVLGDYKRVVNDTWFAAVGSSFFHDEIADLKYRGILNPGIGAFLVRDEDVKFSLEAGPAYVWEKKGDITDDYLAPRVADRLTWKVSETAKLFQYAEFLTSVDDTENYIVTAEGGIEAALNSYLSLVLSVRDNYINQPAEGRVQNDVATITALKVTL